MGDSFWNISKLKLKDAFHNSAINIENFREDLQATVKVKVKATTNETTTTTTTTTTTRLVGTDAFSKENNNDKGMINDYNKTENDAKEGCPDDQLFSLYDELQLENSISDRSSKSSVKEEGEEYPVDNEERRKKRNQDPLFLAGIFPPPRELRQAQNGFRQALRLLTENANVATTIRKKESIDN